jgi:hypothetical protein
MRDVTIGTRADLLDVASVQAQGALLPNRQKPLIARPTGCRADKSQQLDSPISCLKRQRQN